MDSKLFKYVLIPLAVILIGQRFFHLYTFVENPHSWRQLDTLFYAYDFYKNGIDLFAPSVSWMGNYKTVVLEFPILAVILSFTFYLPGDEIVWMRVICFLMFLLSALYFYKLVKLFNTGTLASFSAIVYLLIPLSVYYSRALIIDFAVMLCSIAMIYYYVRAADEDSVKFIIIGSLFAVIGCLMKVPYMFVGYIATGLYCISNKRLKFGIKYLYLFIIPVVVFLVWQVYISNVNNLAPDWFFIPDYFKFTGMSSWYFGNLSDRLDWGNWNNLIMRGGASVITFIGFALFIPGVFVRKAGIDKRIFNYYSIGLLLYLLIFLKLNFIHDYYQIPFIAAVSFYIGVTLEYIYRKLESESVAKAIIVTAVSLVILGINGIWFTERWYYKPDPVRIEASKIIREITSQEDLIITSIVDTDPRDSRLNSPSYRYGWSIRQSDLSAGMLDSLQKNGANYLILISNEAEIDQPLKEYLSKSVKKGEKMLKSDPSRKIYIYKF